MNARSYRRVLAFLGATLLSACIRTTPEIVKIGLAAPFEGRYREIGVDAIPAARLAVAEWASNYQSTGLAFEITAYDDASDPTQAAQVAQRLVSDTSVAIVVGHWRDDTTLAALPIYESANVPLVAMAASELNSHAPVYNLSPSVRQLAEAAARWQSMQTFQTQIVQEQEDVLLAADEVQQHLVNASRPYLGGPISGMSQFYTLGSPSTEGMYFVSGSALPQDSLVFGDQSFSSKFVEGYKERSLGASPGMFAVSAYQATWLAMTLVAESRGLAVTAPVEIPQFDRSGRIINPPLYVFQWENSVRVLNAILSTNP